MTDIIISAGFLLTFIGVPVLLLTAAWDLAYRIIYGRK